MKKTSHLFLICSLLLISMLCQLDHHFLKQNDGFSIRTILGHVPFESECPSSDLTDEMRHALNQPFYYLAKGHQSYVFASEDGEHVIKLYRFPSHLRPFPWLNHPFSSHWSSRRKAIMAYNEEKLRLSLRSYQIAFEELYHESGVEWIHLNPTENGLPTLHLIDLCGNPYEIPLDNLCLILQKRFTPIFDALEAMKTAQDRDGIQHVTTSLLECIEGNCRKGIVDTDPVLDKNYGWDGTRVVYIDIGRFVKLKKEGIKANSQTTFHCEQCKTQAQQITPILSEWLKNWDEELFNDFIEKTRSIPANAEKESA